MLPSRYQKIEGIYRQNHPFLRDDDVCYFLGEYTPGASYTTPTNDLIFNFKIKPTKILANPSRAKWKLRAINEVGDALAKHFKAVDERYLIVPIPTSKCRGHEDYDDRLQQALTRAREFREFRFAELVRQYESTKSDHEGGRQSYEELRENCYVDESVMPAGISRVMLFDDVITDAKHFRVCKDLIQERFPTLDVRGFFIARRVRQEDEVRLDEFDDY